MTGLKSLIEADTKHHSQHSVAITTGIGQCQSLVSGVIVDRS